MFATRRRLLQAGVTAMIGPCLPLAEQPTPGKMPRRVLGKTGVSVPILGFGTAPAGYRRSDKSAVALFHEAIDLGVNYFDTAPMKTGYGWAQRQLGSVLAERRKEVFLVTKCHAANGDAVLR